MRYYDIALSDPKTGKAIFPRSLNGPITSLLSNGQPNRAALNIELDIPVYPGHLGDTKAYVKVFGLGLQDLGNAFDLNGKNIIISGGMSKGLPLSNPAQIGVLVRGTIFQAFGNWIGTDQSLDMYIGPPTGSPDAPINCVFNWLPGMPLSTAIAQTLSTALPGMKQDIQISHNLVINYQEPGYYYSLSQFAAFINQRTIPMLAGAVPNYLGVQIAINDNTVIVWDGTKMPDPKAIKQIQFQDLLGQCTWSAPFEISAKLVLRGDLSIGDVVAFPRGLITTTPQALSNIRGTSTFTGNFKIIRMQHWGNFRQPDAESWNTTIWCAPAL